jgi:hypothetical protein
MYIDSVVQECRWPPLYNVHVEFIIPIAEAVFGGRLACDDSAKVSRCGLV